jgi:serine/threonine protein phosphatase PrpC
MQTSWPVTGGSIIGSAHVRKGLPNQDAYGSKNLGGGIQVLALSDGHGGERHPYSDIGSKAAVEAAIECVEAYVSVNNRPEHAKLLYDFEVQLSKEIQSRWLENIQKSNVFEEAMQFGCTLLLAVKFNDLIIFLQLGDGKIAVVYTDGVIYYPMPRDLRYENNETASMAQEHAWAEMKVVTMQMESNIHTIVLASDGVENAYPQDYYDDAFFYMALAISVKNAEALFEVSLVNMLERAASYSKDDTSAVMWHNPNTSMLETEVPESLSIWMGDYPNGWLPVACHLESTLDKRIDLAILLVEAIQKRDGDLPALLTLKQIYLDRETMQLTINDDGVRETADRTSICKLIMGLLMLPGTPEFTETLEDICMGLDAIAIDLIRMKDHLISIKRQLRYDYANQQFAFDGKASVVSFKASNGCFPLFYNSDLYLHQFLPLISAYDCLIGRVVQHPKHKSIWGIVNLSQHSWQVIGGKQNSIEPGMTVTLQEGITVFIHGIPVKIRIINQ